MKKNFLYLITFILLPFVGAGQSLKNFDFEHHFSKNVYNSELKLYTKDMVAGPSVSFKIKFTRRELKSVYNKLREIQFWNYPDVYKYKNADTLNLVEGHLQPCSGYSMKVIFNGEIKSVQWSNCITGTGSFGRQFEKLMELHQLIYKIIASKKAYKNSPPLRSAYL